MEVWKLRSRELIHFLDTKKFCIRQSQQHLAYANSFVVHESLKSGFTSQLRHLYLQPPALKSRKATDNNQVGIHEPLLFIATHVIFASALPFTWVQCNC